MKGTKATMGKSNSCVVDQYVGTDFDAVKEVAEHIDTIAQLGPVAGGIQGIVDNLDELVQLANNLEGTEIHEKIILEGTQTTVQLNKVFANGCTLYVSSPRADIGRLVIGKDYDVVSPTIVELKRTYPMNSVLLAVQTIIVDRETATLTYDISTAFNREMVLLSKGNVLKDSVWAGETIKPLLVYQNRQYICDINLDREHVITETQGVHLDGGNLKVFTDQGELFFSSQNAKALPRSEIYYAIGSAARNILINDPVPWKPDTTYNSVSTKIIHEGIEYLPKTIPHTSASSWEADSVHWDALRGIVPGQVKVTTPTLDLGTVVNSAIITADAPVNVVRFDNLKKFTKYTLIPSTDNITLVHSPEFLNLGRNHLQLILSQYSVYEFYVDHLGVPRLVGA